VHPVGREISVKLLLTDITVNPQRCAARMEFAMNLLVAAYVRKAFRVSRVKYHQSQVYPVLTAVACTAEPVPVSIVASVQASGQAISVNILQTITNVNRI